MKDLRKTKFNNMDINKIRSGECLLDFIKKDNKKDNKFNNKELIAEYSFDIETWGLNPYNLALGIFFNGFKYDIFYTREEIINYIEELSFKYEKVIIWAHNGVKFDYHLFFNEIKNNNYTIEKSANTYKISYKNNGCEIIFRDTIYMLKGTLKNLAETYLGVKEQKLILDDKFKNPIKYGWNIKEYEENIKEYNIKNISEEDIEYCKRDTEILFKIVNKTEIREDLKILEHNTIASIGFEKLQKGMIEARYDFLTTKKGKTIDKDILTSFDIDEGYDNCFKQLFKGGLTFVFNHETNEDEEIITLDINSSYPDSMTKEYPETSLLKHYVLNNKKDIEKWQEMMINYPNGMSNIIIKVKENLSELEQQILRKIPLLNFQKKQGMNYYDLSDGEEYFISIMNDELKIVIDYYDVKFNDECFSIYCNKEDLYNPMEAYIRDKYNERKEIKNINPGKAESLKLLMNSAYGRMAMQVQNDLLLIDNEYQIIKHFQDMIEETLNNRFNQTFENDNELYKYLEDSNNKNIFDSINEENEIFYDERQEINEKILNLTTYINLNENLFNHIKVNMIRKMDKEQNNLISDVYLISYKNEKRDGRHVNYCISSTITSKSRVKIIKMLIKTLKLGYKINYVDTDSIHIIFKKGEEEKILNDFKDDINKEILGKWKNEGVYQKEICLSKKHYGLLNKTDDKLVLKKYALKGFNTEKPIDFFIESKTIVNINKIYTMLKNVDKNEAHQIIKKEFLSNLAIHTDLNNELFRFNDENIDEIVIKKRERIQKLFHKMVNESYIEDNGEIIKVSDIKWQRSEEIENQIQLNLEQGLYEIDHNPTILNKTYSKRLEKFLIKTKKPKTNKPRKSRAKTGGL